MKNSYDKTIQNNKNQSPYFVNKGASSQSYGFSSSRVWIGELDHKESCTLKNWCFWTVVLEKTRESPLDCKEIIPVSANVLNIHWKDWCWSWRSNSLAIWCKELTHWKRPWCWERLKAQEEKGMTENEMIEKYHRLNGHEFEQVLGVGDGQGSVACCSPWGRRVRHDWVTELNWTVN